MATLSPHRKGVLVDVHNVGPAGGKAPAGLAKKLSSPLKKASAAGLRERLDAAAARKDMQEEEKRFKAAEAARRPTCATRRERLSPAGFRVSEGR